MRRITDLASEDISRLSQMGYDHREFSRIRSRGRMGGLVSNDTILDNKTWVDKDSVIRASNISGSTVVDSVVDSSYIERSEIIKSNVVNSSLLGHEFDKNVKKNLKFSNHIENSNVDTVNLKTSTIQNSLVNHVHGSYATINDSRLHYIKDVLQRGYKDTYINKLDTFDTHDKAMLDKGFSVYETEAQDPYTFYMSPKQNIQISPKGAVMLEKSNALEIDTARILMGKSLTKEDAIHPEGDVSLVDGKLMFEQYAGRALFTKDVLERGLKAYDLQLDTSDLEDLKEDGMEL